MIWKKVPQEIGRALDGYTAKVKAELDEASRLRAEAEALLASYQAEANEAAEDSKKIVAHARAEAERLVAEAKIQAEEAIARRTRLAEEKISAAERAATDGLRARAADMAIEAARSTNASTTDASVQKKLTEQASGDKIGRAHGWT